MQKAGADGAGIDGLAARSRPTDPFRTPRCRHRLRLDVYCITTGGVVNRPADQPARPGSSPSRPRPEERLLGRAEQEPVLLILAQEIEPVADQLDAVGVFVLDDLERAVALPHAAPRPEGRHDAPDHG